MAPSTTLPDPDRAIALPPAQTTGGRPLHDVLQRRRSLREFTSRPLSLSALSQLCWAAQGITSPKGDRTCPSAGGLFPVTVLVATSDGLFEYLPADHSLRQRQAADLRQQLQEASPGQEFVGSAAACIVLAMDVNVTAAKYSRLAERCCLIEIGHAAQNVLLEATSLGLGCVPVGILDEGRLTSSLGLGRDLEPVYLLPVGHSATVGWRD